MSKLLSLEPVSSFVKPDHVSLPYRLTIPASVHIHCGAGASSLGAPAAGEPQGACEGNTFAEASGKLEEREKVL